MTEAQLDRSSGRYSGLRHHAKVHSFRIMTVILAWLLIAAAFYQKPELLTGLQRLIQHGMETVGDAIPPPWGPRIEFVFREIGGFIWLQITLIVVFLRIILSSIAGLWRMMRRRDGTLRDESEVRKRPKSLRPLDQENVTTIDFG